MNGHAGPLLTVGVIGTGSISGVYYARIVRSPALRLKSCASRSLDNAMRQARKFGCEAVRIEDMLADPEIDLVVNLTPSTAHFELNHRILSVAKHLYTEKPFGLSYEEAVELADLADTQGVRIGSAPDTFFGAGHQAGRALIDEGAIGRPVTGAAFVGVPGLEFFHPNPAGFYQPGGEPPFEIGPYFITQLVNLLGPICHVAAISANGPDMRTIRSRPLAGQSFEVGISTSFNALLAFVSGACVTLSMSLDVWSHTRQPIELYGTEGSLKLPDPNFFGGAPLLSRRGGDWQNIDISQRALSKATRKGHQGQDIADYRGVGLVEMAVALYHGREHRTNIGLIQHVTEVICGIMRAAKDRSSIPISTRCERPTPFLAGVDDEVIRLLG